MIGIFVLPSEGVQLKTLDELNRVTHEWELRAARGECAWICSSCCVTFQEGMPDACAHGQAECTQIITANKAEANKESTT